MVSPCQIFSTLVHPSRKYCNFSISQNGHYSHLVFSNSQNFIGWWGPEGRDASPCQIFVKNWKKYIVEILWFFDFTRWPPSPFWIFEFVNFYYLTGSQGQKHIIVPNFMKIGQSFVEILQFFFFWHGCCPPSWFVWGTFAPTMESTWRFITVQNLVMIDAVVFIIWTFQYLHIWLENAYSRPKN